MTEITHVTKNDLSFIESLETRLFSDPWKESSLLSWLDSKGAKGYLFKVDDTPIAYALFQTVLDEGELLRCGVLPEMMRQKIGYTLLSFALNEEKNKGCKRIFLEVRSQNLPARKLYEKLDFVLLGERKDYYQNPKDNAILYEKNL